VSLIATDISNWLHDTTIVLGDSVYIGLPLFEVSDAMWYTINMNYIGTGSGIKVKPTQAVTKYIQAIDVCNSIRYDTMTVYAYPLGIEDMHFSSFDVNIYPNPTGGLINLSCNHCDDNTEVIVYDILGKKVWHKLLKYASGETFIRFELAAGIYNITITNKSTSEHETKKLIVE
jgi:hypothetical protein